MSKYSINHKRHRRTRNLLIILVVLFVLLVAASALVHQVYKANLQPVSSSQTLVEFTIPKDSTVRQIAASLENEHLIKSAWAFEWYIRSQELQDQLIAGTYELRPSQSVSEIAAVVTNGKIVTKLVTILPAQRLDQIKTTLVNKYGFPPLQVIAALNPALYSDNPALIDKPPTASLEGYLYPDSYGRDSSTTAKDIIQASLNEMAQHLTPSIRQGFIKQGLSIHQGVILASMVEQEVSNQSDRARAAQVFLTRLQKDMPLGSDVTARYGAIVAGKAPSLQYDSPYNTLLHKGLPVGPISNVSDSSLEAVAFPADTDYLYFVSGDNGQTYFSHTLAEHKALAAKYCKKLCGKE